MECALPTIVYQVQCMEMASSNNNKDGNASPLYTTLLCTKCWTYGKMWATLEMVRKMYPQMLRGLSYVYHPFKIGKLGIATYQEWFYQVQKPLIGQNKSLV
jgi:hypothetical protein